MLPRSYLAHQVFDESTAPKPRLRQSWRNLLLHQKPAKWSRSLHSGPVLAVIKAEDMGKTQAKDEASRFTWIQIGPNITEEQKQAMSQLPHKMTKRCKAFVKQIICFSPETGNLSDLLAAWVTFMKPRRADWLAVLKQLKLMEHPLYLQV